MKRVVYVGLATLIAGFAGLWLVGSAISAPATNTVGAAPQALRAERVRFASQSGASIAAWYGAPLSGSATVVLSHGVRGSRLQLSERARFLREAGYGILVYDAQAHGESTGTHITFGYLEAHDAAAAVAYVRARNAQSIGFIGPSLAGASALLGPEPLSVDALVLEAVYPTFEAAVTNRIALRLGSAVAPLLSRLLLHQVQPRLGFDPFRLNPVETIGRSQAPLLLIAGSEDRHTTLAESEALFRAARRPKQLWVVEGAAHQSFHRFAGTEYERRVLEFFGRYL